MTETVTEKPRRMLVLLLAVFFLPLAVSIALYFSGWRPDGGTNHGELLQPLRQLPADARALEGKWSLVYVGDGSCDEACRNTLHVAAQVHLLLNKDMDRVNRALLATAACCDRALLDLQHDGIKVIDLSEAGARDSLIALLPPGDHSHALFVVDPLLNVVMRFDTRENPRGLLDDMKKLLKLSHIG